MVDNTTIVSNPKDRQELKLILAEMTNCMRRMDDERESIKEMAKAADEKFGVKAKLIKKLATTMYKHNYADVQAENEHFEILYETLVEGKKTEDAA
jgi:hypothetical protein